MARKEKKMLYAVEFQRFCFYYDPPPEERATVVVDLNIEPDKAIDADRREEGYPMNCLLELAFEQLWVQYPHWNHHKCPFMSDKGWSSALTYKAYVLNDYMPSKKTKP